MHQDEAAHYEQPHQDLHSLQIHIHVFNFGGLTL